MVASALQEIKQNGCLWLYKLLRVCISTGALNTVALIKSPIDIHAIIIAFVSGSVIGGLLYLKQSPLPPVAGVDTALSDVTPQDTPK